MGRTASQPEALKLFVVSNVGRRNVPPFFQTINAIAAIFRASVRRAISGLIPLATRAHKIPAAARVWWRR